MKKKTLRKVVDDLAIVLQKHVRLKQAVRNQGYCKCASCGTTRHWKEMDGGHFVSRNHQSTKVLEENIHPQCKGCNLRSGKGDTLITLKYQEYMEDMYGQDFVKELKTAARKPIKHFRPDIEDEIKRIRALNKELENQCQ